MKKIEMLGILALLAVLAMPIASAQNVTLYFEPQHSCVPQGYCNNTTVELWLDIPAGLQVSHGQIGFEYDPLCGDILARNFNVVYPDGIDPTWSFWNSTGSPNCWDDNTDWVVFKFFTPRNGPIHAMVGDFTIHCNSTDYCINHLNFSCEPDCVQGCTGIWNSDALQVPHNTSNGTFECGINVDTTVYNPDTGEWEDSISNVELNTELRFRTNVSAGPCYNYTNLVVEDTLPAFLTYSDNAIPFEPADLGGNTYQWTFSTLSMSETMTIEFNATASDTGSGANEVTVTMNCVECDGAECSGADTAPVHVKSAGTCGDVDGIPGVTMNDGRQIFMNIIHGSEYPISDYWAADCDGNCDGMTMNDGRQIFMNIIHGSEYPLDCACPP